MKVNSDAKKFSDCQKKVKWDPPTYAEEKHFGCRIIYGKEYYYHYKYKRRKIVDNPTPLTGDSLLPVAASVAPPVAYAYGSVATSDQAQ